MEYLLIFVSAIATSLVFQPNTVRAACDYASLNTDLNACMETASGVSTTKWAFPVGGIADQATICLASNLATLTTCIETIMAACETDAKSLKMFGKDGANIVNAYTNWCASSIFTEATSCMSSNDNAGDRTTYATAETAFTTSVVALNSAASSTEICGLATTLVYTAYYDLLTQKCDVAAHLQVWQSFYDDILNTYLCTSCTSSATSQVKSSTLAKYLPLVAILCFQNVKI